MEDNIAEKLSFKVTFPCPNHPSGFVHLCFTGQQWTGKDEKKVIPKKRCKSCGWVGFPQEFLKRSEMKRNGYAVVVDSSLCATCEPREALLINVGTSGKLAMRVSLRDERGEPYRWRDEKKKKQALVRNPSLRRTKDVGKV